MNPQNILAKLQAGADPRKQRSLQVLHDVCQDQHARGLKDFSIATIGKLSAKRDGPAVQSIRNASGAAYRDLLLAWADFAQGHTRKPALSGPQGQGYADLLLRIGDPVLRAETGFLIAELKDLRGQVRLLKQLAEQSVTIDMRPKIERHAEVEVLPPVPLKPGEIRALEDAISDTVMEREGWKANRETGEVMNAKGRRLYNLGYITAIAKVVEQCRMVEAA